MVADPIGQVVVWAYFVAAFGSEIEDHVGAEQLLRPPGYARNEDLDEVAGATDAIACSQRLAVFSDATRWLLGDK